MYWLLLPVAALTLLFGLRTPSPTTMAGWLLLTLLLLVVWAWIRYRVLFPGREREVRLTPLAPDEMDALRRQTEARRTQANEAASAEPPRLASTPRASASIPPREPVVVAPLSPLPAPAVATPRPSGRAVFVLPDEPPAPSGPRQV